MSNPSSQPGVRVAKFGGTSVATAEQQLKVKNIINLDESRRFIIPSAPGKAFSDDIKITDLLYLAHDLAHNHQKLGDVWKTICKRFQDIIDELDNELQYPCDLQIHLDEVRDTIRSGKSTTAYVASRGEALNGYIIASLLNAEYVDAADVIRFDSKGCFDPCSYELIRNRCNDSEKKYVIPGFYGADVTGTIYTFSRGGSDVTGAIVAHAVDADVYENWTDVSGFLTTDPRIVPHARSITEITYRELRELSYMGASVLHEEAVFPVRDKSIPINIRNTNKPEDPGTIIVEDRDAGDQIVTGIAGKKGFNIFYIEKALMNNEIGFGRRVLDVFERHGISFEHMPSGIDTLSVVISDEALGNREDQILDDLKLLHPDQVSVYKGMALIATVGKGMNRAVGTAAKLFSALSLSEVNIRMIDQGSSEQNIIVGVEEKDTEAAICAIHDAFMGT